MGFDIMGCVKYTLFINNNEDSRKAIEYLRSIGLDFQIINVSTKNKGWLLLEYGTMELPILTTINRIIYGYENIKKFFGVNYE